MFKQNILYLYFNCLPRTTQTFRFKPLCFTLYTLSLKRYTLAQLIERDFLFFVAYINYLYGTIYQTFVFTFTIAAGKSFN